MRILVTGGTGFLGAATARAGDAAGHEMVAFDHSMGLDVTNVKSIRDAFHDVEPDHVIHLAGVLGNHELFDDPHRAVDVNIHGTLNVLQLCAAYGTGYTAITMPPVFDSVYTATKVCADRLATAWHKSMGVRTSKVVAYNAYGPAQKFGPGHPQKIIPTFATLAWRGEPIPIWGNGEQTVDLIDDASIGRMLIDATRFGDDETFDAGTGYAMTVNEVAEFVRKVVAEETGGPVPLSQHLPMRRGETPTHIVAQGRGWDLLKWHPQMDWPALRATIRAYRPADHGGAAA
jgi:UDP-glucose 4-epimerase